MTIRLLLFVGALLFSTSASAQCRSDISGQYLQRYVKVKFYKQDINGGGSDFHDKEE